MKFDDLKKNRPSCYLFNELVSNRKDELEFKYFLNQYAAVSGVLSTLPKNHFRLYYDNPKMTDLKQNCIKMVPKTLSQIIKSVNINHYDLLSLDVEGHELEVSNSWDFSIIIDVILVETLGTERDILVRNILLNNGYIFDQNYKHNEIYIHNTFKKLIP